MMINSRSIEALLPIVQVKAFNFKSACLRAGIDVLITSTYRDNEAQDALYARGRTTMGENPKLWRPLGSVVTNARGGDSWHNHRCAFDFVPLVNGKASWNDLATFTKCGKIAESCGLEWAGRWKSFKELAHCQYTGGLTLAQLKAGERVI